MRGGSEERDWQTDGRNEEGMRRRNREWEDAGMEGGLKMEVEAEID